MHGDSYEGSVCDEISAACDRIRKLSDEDLAKELDKVRSKMTAGESLYGEFTLETAVEEAAKRLRKGGTRK